MILTRTETVTPARLLHALAASLLAHAAALALLPGLRPGVPPPLSALSVDFRLPPKREETEPPKPEPEIPKPARRPAPSPPPRIKERIVPPPAPAPAAKARDTLPAPQAIAPQPPTLIAAPAESSRPPAFSVPAPTPTQPPQPPRVTEGAPAAAAPVEPNREALIEGYGRRLSRALEPHRRYPRIAQVRGWQGTVEMSIQVLPGGRLGGITLERSSGHTVLDEQALDMMRNATLPAVPSSLQSREFSIRLPVEFRLRN